MSNRPILVSNLKNIYHNRTSNLPQLSMAEISGFEEFDSFDKFQDHILNDLRYPKAQQDKLESYGWVPTLFDLSERTLQGRDGPRTQMGNWRSGAAECDELCVFVADVDNGNAAMPVLQMSDVAAGLNALNGPIRFFMYTSYSHTPAKPKFRVVIETDRNFTRAEMARLGYYLNWVALGQQADLSIYDAGDFVFAPPHATITQDQRSGAALNVDATLALQAKLQRSHPASVANFLTTTPAQPKKAPNKKQQKAMLGRSSDMTVRPGRTVADRDVFNSAWLDLYLQRVCGGSHWQTMRSIMGMVWAKNGGELTYGEMDSILREIDAVALGYFVGKYGEEGVSELLNWLMAQPVEPRQPEWHPILDKQDTGLTIEAKEAECGEGKTRDELLRIGRERGRYVYVVPKIDDIDKRRKELFALVGGLAAHSFTIKEAHCRSDGDLRVPLQLLKIRDDLNRLPAGKPMLVFVTQQAATQMDWTKWTDFEIVFDEVPEVFATYRIKARKNAGLLREYVHKSTDDGECYRLGLTAKGRDLAASTDIDDYDAVHFGLTLMMAKDNTFVWVRTSAWDDPADSGVLEFFTVTSPMNLTAFKRVRMLGDEMMKSVTAEVWQTKWGVQFKSLDFPRRCRTVPTAKRVTIVYFAEHRDSSITRFKEGDVPLAAISEFIKKDAGDRPVLWTANERLKADCLLPETDFISPKAHGRNDLQHHTHVAWLAAMKASKFEIASLQSVCGMTSQALTDWREYNALYQFVMRSNLRDFDSAAPVVIYVFSRKQAEYLKQRLGGELRHVSGIVVDEQPRSFDPDGPMTASERNKVKHWRDKVLAAGVSDVRDLPASKPLGKLSEREIRLINGTASRMGAANDDGRDTLAA